MSKQPSIGVADSVSHPIKKSETVWSTVNSSPLEFGVDHVEAEWATDLWHLFTLADQIPTQGRPDPNDRREQTWSTVRGRNLISDDRLLKVTGARWSHVQWLESRSKSGNDRERHRP